MRKSTLIRTLSLFIVLVMGTGMFLTGCGGDDKNAVTLPTQMKETEPGPPVELTVLVPENESILSYEDNDLTRWIEEQCNVKLAFKENVPTTQVGKDIFDPLENIDIVLSFENIFVNRCGKMGRLADLTPYYQDRAISANFWDRMEKELTEEAQKTVLYSITSPDTGSIYCVTYVSTTLTGKLKMTPWINQQWLDTLGLSIPTNNEELLAVLRAFRDGDPNGNGDFNDEIPLFGSQYADEQCAWVVDWLISLFCYYNPVRPYNVNADGRLYPVFTTEEYREALGFVKLLYEEKLLPAQAWVTESRRMQDFITPESGVARCGIFLGDLMTHTTPGSDIVQQYVPLTPWNNVVSNDVACANSAVITAECAHPEKAFEVLMLLWSEEGSYRVRYGQKGVHWDDPDPGAVSVSGLPAALKVMDDPMTRENSSVWGCVGSTLLTYADGASVQISDSTDTWTAAVYQKQAEAYRKAEPYLGANIACPLLTFTIEEEDQPTMYKTNVLNRYRKAVTEFCTLKEKDPGRDADWEAYLWELDDLGLDECMQEYQIAYDRAKNFFP